MNFILVCWLDTFDLAASLRTRVGMFKAEGDGRRVLPIRGLRTGTEEDAEDFVGYKAATSWGELTGMRNRIKRIGDGLARMQGGGEISFGRIYMEMLDPGAVIPWRQEKTPYFARYDRAHLVLRSNPGAVMFAGGPNGTEAYSPSPGQLFIEPARMLCSAVNLGETPSVHLVVDFRREAKDQPA